MLELLIELLLLSSSVLDSGHVLKVRAGETDSDGDADFRRSSIGLCCIEGGAPIRAGTP